MLGEDRELGLLGGDRYESGGPSLLDRDSFYSTGGSSLADRDNYGGSGGLGLGNDPFTGGARLGDDRGPGKWDYRTLPNKMLELVRNTGDMHQDGTGYYTDSESEMITILAYLNFGERTGITDSMIEQIEAAIKQLDETKLREREDEEKSSFININF